MNVSGDGWMGAHTHGWGWAGSTAATGSGYVIYPSAISYTDHTNARPAPPRSRTPLEWLRDQVEEVCEVAVA